MVFFLPLWQWCLLFLFFDSVKVDSGLRKWRANQVSDDRKAWIGAKKGIHSQSTYLCFLKLNSVTMGLYTGRTYNRKINNCIELWWLQYSATYSRSFYPSRRELDLQSYPLLFQSNCWYYNSNGISYHSCWPKHLRVSRFYLTLKKQPEKYWLIKLITTLLISAINPWCKIHL